MFFLVLLIEKYLLSFICRRCLVFFIRPNAVSVSYSASSDVPLDGRQLVHVDRENGPSASSDPVHHSVFHESVTFASSLEGRGQNWVEVSTRVVKRWNIEVQLFIYFSTLGTDLMLKAFSTGQPRVVQRILWFFAKKSLSILLQVS